jgi:hypothetical protein
VTCLIVCLRVAPMIISQTDLNHFSRQQIRKRFHVVSWCRYNRCISVSHLKTKVGIAIMIVQSLKIPRNTQVGTRIGLSSIYLYITIHKCVSLSYYLYSKTIKSSCINWFTYLPYIFIEVKTKYTFKINFTWVHRTQHSNNIV